MNIASIAILILSVASAEIRTTSPKNMNRPNLPLPTLGGKQFWTDIRHFDGWRIQHNHLTGHYRLLDARNVRHAWGDESECREALESAIESRGLKNYSGKVVIVLHGLNRSTATMRRLANHLREADFQVINFQYASGRTTIDAHADSLRRIIQDIPASVTDLSFVGHSMGNIVVRRYLAGSEIDSRIRRMVMIGPPNQGSQLAKMLGGTIPFRMVTGESGTQLAGEWEKFQSRLATPDFEFGIIAGGQDEKIRLSNFLLDGKDDLIVRVAETKLPGAHDFVVRPMLHSTMMKHPETLEMTLRFLQSGHFVAEESRTPIAKDQDATDESL